MNGLDIYPLQVISISISISKWIFSTKIRNIVARSKSTDYTFKKVLFNANTLFHSLIYTISTTRTTKATLPYIMHSECYVSGPLNPYSRPDLALSSLTQTATQLYTI